MSSSKAKTTGTPALAQATAQAPAHGTWGGYDNDFGPSWWQAIMIFGSPVFVYYVIACADRADWGFAAPAAWTPAALYELLIPAWNPTAVSVFFAFVAFQALTYYIVPGHFEKGPVTPAGNTQIFKINALACWFVNVFVFMVFGWHAKWFDAAWVSRNMGAIFNVGCAFGFVFSVAVYVKARLFPTNSDAAFRNDWPQDFFLGQELSPRLPFTSPTSILHQLDSKLFCIGHCGMISWTIVNLSHAARQYQDFGFVSINMILVNVFQAIYTVDWAWKEVWYLYTIDMRHDRLGFYLGWGSFAWLPIMYCLQGWYVAMRNPALLPLSHLETAVIIAVFATGIVLFRLSNNQKDEFRADPNAKIWGKKPEFIEAKYSTGNGTEHRSLLLCSGYWGVSRHFNYFTDLLLCTAFSLPCRFESVLPYFYIAYMLALLLHRSIRDDRKCRAKYGKHWDDYCQRVPYVLVPGIY